MMLAKAQANLAELMRNTTSMTYIQDSYANIETILGEEKANFILLDIGVNMEHFKD
jgi:16S rRNA C1402 N4-methylase RsmH